MNETRWPSWEQPYKTDHRFQVRAGNVVKDGKSYYPSYLLLKMKPEDALMIAKDLLDYAVPKMGAVSFQEVEIALFGVIEDRLEAEEGVR